MKQCSKCKKLLSNKSFYKDKRTKSGLYSACKNCHQKLFGIHNLNSRESQKKWKEKNPDYYKKYMRKYMKKYMKERRTSDFRFKLNSTLGKNICKALQGIKAGRKWESLVGYTLNDLIQQLENLFDDKMSWKNYGSYWHIDHIKPKSLFKYKQPEDPEFKECWALNNLQPLERIANIRKNNKYQII